MEKILLIGKGELFSSVVNYVFSNNSNDWITNFPYEQFLYLQNDVKERGNYQELSKLHHYKRLYLFPANVHEGTLLTAFITEWFLGDLFIVTQDRTTNLIYKKLGAEYVIISKPNCRVYPWFPEQKTENIIH